MKKITPLPWYALSKIRTSHDSPYFSWILKNRVEISSTNGMPNYADNPFRGKDVKHVLNRLPEGLRVCSVSPCNDISLALSIVVTCSKTTVENFCREIGAPIPKENDLYIHVNQVKGKHVNLVQDKEEENEISKESSEDADKWENKKINNFLSILFRRTGPDFFSDGTLNPSPWAKIDIQRILKIPGEFNYISRELTINEMLLIDKIHKLLDISDHFLSKLIKYGFGHTNKYLRDTEKLSEIRQKVPYELPYYSGDIALIDYRQIQDHINAISAYHNLVFDIKNVIDDLFNIAKISEHLKENSQSKITFALQKWWELSYRETSLGRFAKTLWENYVIKLPDYVDPILVHYFKKKQERNNTIQALKKGNLENISPEMNRIFSDLAFWVKTSDFLEKLSRSFTEKLHHLGKILSEIIEIFRDLIFPSLPSENSHYSAMKGISMRRIETLYHFVHKVMRPFAELSARYLSTDSNSWQTFDINSVGKNEITIIKNIIAKRGKCQASLAMRFALDDWKEIDKNNNEKKLVPNPDKFCQVVVTGYPTIATTSILKLDMQRKNLFNLSSTLFFNALNFSANHLKIKLIFVNESETSLIDSRTGNFGLRAKMMSARTYLSTQWILNKIVTAKELAAKGIPYPDSPLLIQQYDLFNNQLPFDPNKIPKAKIFDKDGPIFVSCDPNSPIAINYYLNSSLNMALKTLFDPDWPGTYFMIVTDENGVPDVLRYRGCPIISKKTPLVKGLKTDEPS
ncbi:MAG: hypothetical protein LBF22_13045, partial [Deltaproteobacteria bacterium]|nr:hypothetical protein [Deltaproteobacteria bacterium]